MTLKERKSVSLSIWLQLTTLSLTPNDHICHVRYQDLFTMNDYFCFIIFLQEAMETITALVSKDVKQELFTLWQVSLSILSLTADCQLMYKWHDVEY